MSSRSAWFVIAPASFAIASAGAHLAGCGDEITLGVQRGADAGGADAPGVDFDHDADAGLPPITSGCTGKACGDGCLPCPDGESCEPPPIFHVCSETETCRPERPSCVTIAGGGGSEPSFEACAGLTCGDACEPCRPGDADCTPGGDGRCRRDGACVLAAEAGSCL